MERILNHNIVLDSQQAVPSDSRSIVEVAHVQNYILIEISRRFDGIYYCDVIGMVNSGSNISESLLKDRSFVFCLSLKS